MDPDAVNSAVPKEPTIFFGGSCICGRIEYECGAINSSQACHCITCRKLSGGPYQAFVDVPETSVTFYDREGDLRHQGLPREPIGGIQFLRFSTAGERAYCASCNAPLAMRYKHQTTWFGLVLGSVDDDKIKDEDTRQKLKLSMNIFTEQTAWWFDTSKDGLPSHDRFPREFEEEMKAWEEKVKGS